VTDLQVAYERIIMSRRHRTPIVNCLALINWS